MYNKGDFHMHSTASDGTLTPREVVQLAKNNNVDIIALTDHDNTTGIDEAIAEGLKLGVKVIPGLELSTFHNNESIHIVALFKDDSYKDQYFQDYLNDIVTHRIERAKKIVENLEKYYDVRIDYKRVLEIADGAVARPHIARTILEAGYNIAYEQIFETMLSKNSPAYVENKIITVEEGLSMLRKYNAVTILAHPVLIKKSPVEDLLKFDFDGLEAKYIQNTEDATEKFLILARENNLIYTAGSDFHTDKNYDEKHGSIGDTSLDSCEIELLLTKLN
ncbi:MAG: PHP domain-containing protein [Clostridiaceae bacterium]